MSLVSLMLKKIFERKGRLLTMTMSLMLGMLLFSLIFTIGLNISKNLKTILAEKNYYKTIFLTETERTEKLNLNKLNHVKIVSSIRDSERTINRILDKEVMINISEVSLDSDLLITGYENVSLSSDSIALSSVMLDKLNISQNDILNKTVLLSDGREYVVSLIYNNSEDVLFNSYAIILSKESFSEPTYMIQVDDVDNLEEVVKTLEEHKYDTYHYLDNVKQGKVYTTIIFVIFVIVGLITFGVSSIIVYSSVKFSVIDKYVYIFMLKTMGYDNKKTSLIIIIELVLVYIISAVIFLILYFICTHILSFCFDFSILEEYLENTNIFENNSIALLVSLFLSAFISIVIFIITAKKMEKLNCMEIIMEVSE